MKSAANINTVTSSVTHRYELTTMRVDDFEHMSYTTYGIRVIDGDGGELLAYPDISTSEERVRRLLDSLKSNDVALIHIGDVIEDSLD